MRRVIFVVIIWSIISIPSPALAERAREGYCKFFDVAYLSPETIFVVPDGKRFVLLKFYTSIEAWSGWDRWQLTVDDVLFIDGSINNAGTKANTGGTNDQISQGVHDFPDQCITINSGETLKAHNLHSAQCKMTFIGYFENVSSISDLNGDGKVDLSDFAIMASEWLSGV